MSHDITIRLTSGQPDWPNATSIAKERVIDGSPSASTLVLSDTAGVQMGMWRVTPGAFSTDHAGYLEYIHITEGTGRLVSESGQTTALSPGVTTLMPDGWRGRWEIDTTLTKVYTIQRL